MYVLASRVFRIWILSPTFNYKMENKGDFFLVFKLGQPKQAEVTETIKVLCIRVTNSYI